MSETTGTLSRRNLLRLVSTLPLGSLAMLRGAEPKVVIPPYNTFTEEEEIAIGRKIAAEMDKKLPLLDVGPLSAYVNHLVAELGKQSRRPHLRYAAKIVDAPDVNAASLPGGPMYVFRGLLAAARNESELVSVLGHEIGHVVGRHGTNQLALNFQARRLYDLVKQNVLKENEVIAKVIEQLGGPLVVLASLKYGREQEFEADLFGCYNMLRAGWDARGMISMFLMLRDLHGGDGTILDSILSTHPPGGERANRIREELKTIRVNQELTEDSLAFRTMKLGLGMLPPPPKPQRRESRR
jgi:predicted Zn-dependent protease